MTLIIFLKFFHYLSLFLAGGLGVANGLLASTHKKEGLQPSIAVQKTMYTLAKLGLISVIVLWISGILLTYNVYGSFALGWSFHLKLLGATILLITISFLNYYLFNCRKKGVPLNEKIMSIIPIFARGSLIIILLGIAVLTTI